MKKNQFQYFAIASAVFLTILLTGIFFYVNNQLRSEIEKAGEVSNATLTRVFVNETWTEISALLPPLGSSLDEIKLNPNIKKIDNRMRRFMSYTDVLKVKLYNIHGITTYSSDFDQIGEDKTDNLGFQQALKGNLASELTYRGKFGAFDGQLYNRNLVSTYAPIRDGAQVIAVAEIYSDRTSSIAQAIKLRDGLIVTLVISLLILYSIMLLVARKIYLNAQPEAEHHLPTPSAAKFQPISGIQNRSYLYPIPELSLMGMEELLQSVSSQSTVKNESRPPVASNPLLRNLSAEAICITNRIAKYRMLQSDVSLVHEQKIGLLHFDGMVESIVNYANAIDTIETIQFYQGQKYPNGFVHSQYTIESILTSFIDLIAYGYAQSAIEIKFNGSKATLDIDLISSSNSPANPHFMVLFKELDYTISALSTALAFDYKATISSIGILVSMSLPQLEKSPA